MTEAIAAPKSIVNTSEVRSNREGSNCGITSKLLRSKMAATDIEPAAIMIKRTNIIRMNLSDFSDFGDLIFLAPPCIRDRERS